MAGLMLPAGQSLIYATASIDLTTATAQLKPIFIEGERVRRIEAALERAPNTLCPTLFDN